MLFLPGLSILLGLYGYLFGSAAPDTNPNAGPGAVPASESSADRPTVEAFIPALNEEATIAYAIVSLAAQTRPPDRLTVVDDGSTDATTEIVVAMSSMVDLEIDLIRHEKSGSKTRRLKEVTRASSAEKLFVLDADTYLESETYLERMVDAHHEGVGCAFGIVRPDSRTARESFFHQRVEPLLSTAVPTGPIAHSGRASNTWRDRLAYGVGRWPVEQFRSVLYGVEQSFFKVSQLRLIGTTLFPAGCGVLYDRSALRAVVDDFEAPLGDQLTNSEDIFIGFSLVDRGYRNVQVDGVRMRTTEPSLRKLYRQTYLWSSSYLQSTYYYRSFSRRLRSATGDVTDGIESRSLPEGDLETDGGRDLETDGGTDVIADGVAPMSRATNRADGPAAVRTHGGHPHFLAAVVAAQVVDGLYPTALLVVSMLSVVGFVPLELLVAVVAVEFTLFSLTAAVFARGLLSPVALLVAIPVRLYQLPMGVYVYARVGYELLVGARNWSK